MVKNREAVAQSMRRKAQQLLEGIRRCTKGLGLLLRAARSPWGFGDGHAQTCRFQKLTLEAVLRTGKPQRRSSRLLGERRQWGEEKCRHTIRTSRLPAGSRSQGHLTQHLARGARCRGTDGIHSPGKPGLTHTQPSRGGCWPGRP